MIVRSARLTDGAPWGRYRRGAKINERAVGRYISRADVAAFMLEQVTDGTYLRRTPGVSY